MAIQFLNNATFAGNISVTGTSFLDGLVTIDHNLNIQNSGVLKMGNTEVISATRAINASTGTFTGDVSLADDKKLKFGAGPDFEIYHNSTTNVNYISSLLSRQLLVTTDTFRILNSAGTEQMFRADVDDTVQLYFNNAVKLKTTANGVNIVDSELGIGAGHATASPGNAVIFAPYGAGTNIAGGQIQIYSGRSTGNAAGGSIKFYISPVGSSGSSSNAHAQVLLLDSGKNATFAGSLFLPDNRDIGWNGGFSAGKPTLAAVGTTIKMFPSGSISGEQFTLTPTVATFAGKVSVGGGDTSTAQMALKGQQSLLSFIRGTAGDAQFFMSSDSSRLYFSHTDTQTSNLILKLDASNESATFAGNVSIAEKLIHSGDTNTYIQFPGTNDKIVFATNGSDVLTLDATNAATFTGAITLSGKVSGVTAGTANTDAVNFQQLTDAVTGVLVYQGVWDASGTGGGSPDLTAGDRKVPGYYWIVNVDGQAAPNGTGTTPNEWVTGDWCVFSDQDTDAWQKIDNTNILTGAGTGGTVSGWAGSGTSVTLGNTPLTFAGTVLTTGGDINIGNSASLYLGDSSSATTGKAVFGAGSDLELYSNGTDGYVVAPVDDLVLQAADDIFIYTQGGEDAIIAKGNAAVEIYHNNAKKFETTSTGVSVTGGIVFGDNHFIGNGSGDDLSIQSNTGEDIVLDASGDIVLDADDGDIRLKDGGVEFVTFSSSTGSTFAGSLTVKAKGSQLSSSGYYINSQFSDVTGGANVGVIIAHNDTTNGLGAVAGINGLAFLTFGTTWAERMRITSAGNVGIGTTDPGATLQIGSGNASVLQKIHGAVTAGIQIFTGNNPAVKIAALEQYFSNEGSMQLFLSGTGKVRLRANGDSFLNGGKIGIGTTAPSTILHTKNTSGDNRGILIENTVVTSYAELAVKAAREFRVGTGGSSTGPNGTFYVYDATAAKHRLDITSDGDVQARRPRNNTAGQVALSLQPTDSTIHYGFRIDSTTNSFNLDRVDSAAQLLRVDVSGNATFAGSIDTTAVNIKVGTAIHGTITSSSNSLTLNARNTGKLIFQSGGVEKMRINGDNVGIGATAPSAKLEVTGSIDDNWAGRFENTNTGGYGILAKIAGTSANERIFEARVGTSTKMLISGDGNTTFAGTVTGGNGSFTNLTIDAGEKLRFDGAGGHTFIQEVSNDNLIFATGGTERLRIDSTGDVGIGTNNPAAKLQVDFASYANSNAVANFINGNNPVRVAYDTVVIAQTDVASLSIVETPDGLQANEQKLTFAVGDNASIIRTANTSSGLYINVNAPTNKAAYLTGQGTIAMRFLNNGNVIVPTTNLGIGTTSPSAKIDVVDSFGGASIRVAGLITDSSAHYYGFMHDATDLQGTTQVNTFYSGGAIKASTTIADYAGIRIDTPNVSADGAAVTNNYGVYQSSSLQKNYFAGNIGIGTTSPQSKLHIETGSGGSYTPNVNHDDVTIEGSGNIGLQLFSPATSYQYIAFGDPASVNSGYLRYYHGTNEMVFRTNGGDRMTIDNSGNVGIGTTNPAHKLEVSGGGISIKGNLPGNSLRFDSIVSGTATSRNALFVDSTNVFKIGNTNYTSNDIIGPTKTDNLHVDGTLRVDALSGNAPSTDGYQEPSETIIGGSGSASGMLGDPGAWLDINVDGSSYYIPLYSAG